MSKLKKVLLMCTAYVLVAAIAIGGTIAYLQDDDSDVNVMTLGNVSIAQHEYERATNTDGSYETKEIDGVTSYVLEDFEQGKDLLPIVGDPSKSGAGYAGWDDTVVRMTQVNSYGSMQVFAGKNAQDKFVTVENTGVYDAYVRTLVAIEIGSTDGALIGTSFHQTWKSNDVGKITVNGNNYMLVEYTYAGGQLNDGSWRHENGVLPAGDTSYPNLAQVYLKSEATNEDCAAIDGNSNGTFDILVLSQAVQVDGFDDAQTALDAGFGKSSEKAGEWFDGVVAIDGADDNIEFDEAPADAIIVEGSNKASVLEAIDNAKPGDTIALTVDTTIAGYGATEKLVVDKPITIDLNGKTLTTECGWGGIDLKGGASIVNGTINHTGNTAAIKAFQVGKIENVVINITSTPNKVKGGIVVQNNENYYIGSIKNVVINGATNGIETYNCGTRSAEHPFAIGSIENVSIDATETGILLSAPIGTVVNSSIKGAKYGILAHLKGNYSVSAELINCIVEGAQADIFAWDEPGKTNVGSLSITYDVAMALKLNVVKNFEAEVADRVFIGIK